MLQAKPEITEIVIALQIPRMDQAMQAKQAAGLAVQAGATGAEGQKHVKQALVRRAGDGAAEPLTGRGQAVPPQNRFKSLHIHRRVHRAISPAMLRRVADGLQARFGRGP